MEFRQFIESELERVHLDHPFYGRETIGEFLERRSIPVNPDGSFILYHGRPKSSSHDSLRIGTYLTESQEDARFFAARDRELDAQEDIEVITLKLTGDDINPGIHITLRRPYQIKG